MDNPFPRRAAANGGIMLPASRRQSRSAVRRLWLPTKARWRSRMMVISMLFLPIA
jgi:hypothetical protein